MKRTVLSLMSVFSSVLLISCSKQAMGSAKFAATESNSMADSKFQESGSFGTRFYSDADFYDAEEEILEEAPEESTGAQFERKLIKTGSINLEVESLSEAESSIKNWCSSMGGYVESSSSGLRDGNITVRIPSTHFEIAMDSAGQFGSVKSKNVSSEDVTDSFYDLQSRLGSKKIMRERLEAYLKDAKNMEDLLQIERELNSVISDIESMESRMKHLSGQIDFSQIRIQYALPYRASENQSFMLPNFKQGFRRFVSNVLDFLVGFVQFILYLIFYGIPVLAAIALFYWLLFGKLGLLKKLFRRLHGKSSKEESEATISVESESKEQSPS